MTEKPLLPDCPDNRTDCLFEHMDWSGANAAKVLINRDGERTTIPAVYTRSITARCDKCKRRFQGTGTSPDNLIWRDPQVPVEWTSCQLSDEEAAKPLIEYA